MYKYSTSRILFFTLILIFIIYTIYKRPSLNGNIINDSKNSRIINNFNNVLDSFNKLKKSSSFPLKLNNNESDKTSIIEVLSRQLTNTMKIIGQLTCEIATDDVSINGGWCAKISAPNSTEFVTDYKLMDPLSKFLENKIVASFGEGPGFFKKRFLELKHVKEFDAYDGAPYCEQITNSYVRFLDLSVPIYHLPIYDWIISLEVAEHIPKEYEHIFIDNLCRHSKQGIVLSWAKLGQGGHSHVNNRNFDYVKDKLELRGFVHDAYSSDMLKNASSLPWLKENLNVFKRNLIN